MVQLTEVPCQNNSQRTTRAEVPLDFMRFLPLAHGCDFNSSDNGSLNPTKTTVMTHYLLYFYFQLVSFFSPANKRLLGSLGSSKIWPTQYGKAGRGQPSIEFNGCRCTVVAGAPDGSRIVLRQKDTGVWFSGDKFPFLCLQSFSSGVVFSFKRSEKR